MLLEVTMIDNVGDRSFWETVYS